MKLAIVGLIFSPFLFGQLNTNNSVVYNMIAEKSDVTLNLGGNVVNASGAGFLAGINCKLTTAPSGSNVFATNLTIQIDGKTATVIPLYNATSTTWVATSAIQAFKLAVTQTGNAIGDGFLMNFNMAFGSTAVISINQGGGGDLGVYSCAVVRGVK